MNYRWADPAGHTGCPPRGALVTTSKALGSFTTKGMTAGAEIFTSYADRARRYAPAPSHSVARTHRSWSSPDRPSEPWSNPGDGQQGQQGVGTGADRRGVAVGHPEPRQTSTWSP